MRRVLSIWRVTTFSVAVAGGFAATSAQAQVWEVRQQAPFGAGDEAGMEAGGAVAIGNFDCNAFADLIGGAPGLDTASQTDAGGVGVVLGGPLGLTFLVGGFNYDSVNGRGGSALAAGDFDDDPCDEFAVGIPGEDVSTSDEAGVVHVFGWDGDSVEAGDFWHSAVTGVAGASEPFDHFGEVLAVGNFNGDAFADLAIGVPGENVEGKGTALDAGAVTILYGSAAGLTAAGSQEFDETDLPDGAQANAHFGAALAAGNFNGDDYGDLAIGVPDRDVDAGGVKANAGQVVVLYGSAGGLVTTGHERISDSDLGGFVAADDRFGAALAATDIDFSLTCIFVPCYTDLAVGIPGEPSASQAQSGGVAVAYGSGDGLLGSPFQFLSQSGISGSGDASEVGDHFGAVLAAGDLDSSIGGDLAIGVPDEKVGVNEDQGMVHLVLGGGGSLVTHPNQRVVQYAGLLSGPGAADDHFGGVMAVGNIDGSGPSDMAFGIPGFDTGLTDAGTIVVLYGALFADGFASGGFGFWTDVVP